MPEKTINSVSVEVVVNPEDSKTYSVKTTKQVTEVESSNPRKIAEVKKILAERITERENEPQRLERDLVAAQAAYDAAVASAHTEYEKRLVSEASDIESYQKELEEAVLAGAIEEEETPVDDPEGEVTPA